ncbi:MAG: Hsp70 family protein, partial [Phycisphaerales bacterium]
MDASREPLPSDPIVGIDLGTTNSLVAYCFESGPRVLGGEQGAIVPSVVRFLEGGAAEVGAGARLGRAQHAASTVSSAKRFMGRTAAEGASFAEGLGARLVEGPRGLAAFEVAGRVVTPQQVAAEVLRELKSIAERELGRQVRRAVVTVPAYFDDAQRQATRDAARLAGLEAVRIVNEPTAAALAYGLGQTRRSERIAVYDLGGGTFDVTILDIVPAGEAGTGADCFQVLSTAGDTARGGDDVDRAVAAHWFARDPALQQARQDHALLVAAAEEAKIALAERDATEVSVWLSGGRRSLSLSRAELDAAAAPLVERTLAACHRALLDAWIPAS